MDDMNYLLAREQVSLLRASTATDPSARFAHRELARQYGLLLAGSPLSASGHGGISRGGPKEQRSRRQPIGR
jgi:hypothetical protein